MTPLVLIAWTWQATAANVSLAWDANLESDIVGYKVYFGTSSGSYSDAVDIGNRTSHTIPNLLPGRTYFLALAAYNTAGLESDLSAEVSYTPPGIALAHLGAGQYRVRFSDSPGATCRIEFTERLDSPVWLSLGTHTANAGGLVELIDSPGIYSPRRFYRAARVSALSAP